MRVPLTAPHRGRGAWRPLSCRILWQRSLLKNCGQMFPSPCKHLHLLSRSLGDGQIPGLSGTLSISRRGACLANTSTQTSGLSFHCFKERAWFLGWCGGRGEYSLAERDGLPPPILLLRLGSVGREVARPIVRRGGIHSAAKGMMSNHKTAYYQLGSEDDACNSDQLSTWQNPESQSQGGGAGNHLGRLFTNQNIMWLYYAWYTFGLSRWCRRHDTNVGETHIVWRSSCGHL